MIAREPSRLRAGLAGALAGLAGSLCCLGPAAALLLGLGSSSALWGLVLSQRAALAGGSALLLASLALALRQARSCPVGWARWRAPLTILLAFSLSYGALGLLLPGLAARAAQLDQPPAASARAVAAPVAAPTLRRATLIIEKMTCPPCAVKVQHLLARQPAVRRFVALEGNEEVQIDYDAGQTDAEALRKLIPSALHVSLLQDAALPD